MALAQGVFQLKGVVQHYAWGGYNYIPTLLGAPHPAAQPWAEYWLGAHPNLPSETNGRQLTTLLDDHGADILSENIYNKYKTFPYLLKVLDVRKMLSIQVHPSLDAAAKGFDAEEDKGIPAGAPHRNYKDRNHKPEMLVALGDFWLLHGFKEEGIMGIALEAAPELRFLLPIFEEKGYKGLYETVMLMDQSEVDRILQPLASRILPLYDSGELEKDEEDFWAARAIRTFCTNDHYDRGIFSIYLFNLLHLKEGEGIFQPAGLPHAYLEGQNVELMSNSDNVLRAGLTDKHIDVAELLRHVVFEATHPAFLVATEGARHHFFETPAEEFALHRYHLPAEAKEEMTSFSAEIFLVISGAIRITSGAETQEAGRGGAVLVTAGRTVTVEAKEEAVIFRAVVPEKGAEKD